MLATLLAVGWEPELRGILTVMIGTAEPPLEVTGNTAATTPLSTNWFAQSMAVSGRAPMSQLNTSIGRPARPWRYSFWY